VPDRRIVVGIDGSASSVAALRWALDEARLRGAGLDIVHAWSSPYVGEAPGVSAFAGVEGEMAQRALALLERTVRSVGPPPGVHVNHVLMRGAAAAVLIDVARGAELLVVGTRGAGGFLGLQLGSVSQQCAHHAPCPVVIVDQRSAT
jgi:nucleotide-binding universal stress UspA family protein